MGLEQLKVEVLDMFGNEQRIIQTARVSYGSESDGGPKDEALIKMLMHNSHGTPFEHVVFFLHVECPIFVARQWLRHRWGAFNEKSGRYTKISSVYTPDNLREGTPVKGQPVDKMYAYAVKEAQIAYECLIQAGVPMQTARMVMPVASMTEFYWTVNLKSMLNFLTQRLAPGAQYEIRVMAKNILEQLRSKLPITVKAFEASLPEATVKCLMMMDKKE